MARTLRPSRLWLNDDHDFEHHGAAILLLVRDGIASDWEGLCRVLRFDRDPRSFHSGHFALKRTIQGLVDTGLLESSKTHVGPYRATEQSATIIQALGISLTQAANLPYYSGLAVRPVFGKPARVARSSHAFVIMPFRHGLRRVYDGPVKSACRALQFSVQRADDIFSTTHLVDDIWNAVVNAFVVVADCTDKNANVFYELGLAHTLGKPVILITQRREDIPADVRHIRYIKYSPTPVGLRKLEADLTKTLRQIAESVWTAEQAAAPAAGRRAPAATQGTPPWVRRRRSATPEN